MGAALVAISRTMDYRRAFYPSQWHLLLHSPFNPTDHWHDVLIGSLVGTFFGFFSYRQYYPDLSSPLSHRPYSPRIKREDAEVLPTYNTNSNNDGGDFVGQGPTDPSSTGPGYRPNTYHSDEAYELEGTVPRPEPGSLTKVWHDGEGDSGDNAIAEREALSPLPHGAAQPVS